MPERIVLLKMGDYSLSLPFDHVDEILGADRAVAGTSLPEGVAADEDTDGLWVSSRGRWLKVTEFLPGIERKGNSQILVITCGMAKGAYFVDQVMGIEKAEPPQPFPEVARPFSDIPFNGVRFLKGQPVLELDLSSLISLDIRGGLGD